MMPWARTGLMLALAASLAFAWHAHGERETLGEALAARTPHVIDVGFAQSMSSHHRQAIGMAQLMLDDRPTPLAPLARSVAYSQLLELGQMTGFLRLWDKPLQTIPLDMGWMRAAPGPMSEDLRQYLLDCERAPAGMPGLASPAQLQQLRTLDGPERDALFLELMLAHHEGGLPMARFAAQHATQPAVRQLAASIVLEQSRELDRLLRTQRALRAQVTP